MLIPWYTTPSLGKFDQSTTNLKTYRPTFNLFSGGMATDNDLNNLSVRPVALKQGTPGSLESGEELRVNLGRMYY